MNNSSYKVTPITAVRGISDKRAALYKKLGIETVGDLITHYPREYVDYTAPQRIADCEVGEAVVIRAEVVKKLKPYIGRISLYKLVLTDGESELLCTFFNSEYSFNRLFVGKEYLFFGKLQGTILQKELNSPVFIEPDSVNKLVPRYSLTAGLSQTVMANNIRSALELIGAELEASEPFPAQFTEKHELGDLPGRAEALRQIHFPETREMYAAAKRRLGLEELLTLRLGMLRIKSRNRAKTGAQMAQAALDEFYAALPFTPTGAQVRAVEDCRADLCGTVPMNRLLQGDVGSGKTLVAAAVCYFAFLNHYQATMMAPTEILAKQHHETLDKFLRPLGVSVVLLTGSLSPKEKREIRQEIEAGRAHVVIGTQALIQKDVNFHRLGLVVADEQHRFGVEQRAALLAKGLHPHMLVMSATPIPRTLALIIYGDLDISLLDEMPKGRVPIKTYGVDSSFRERLYRFILKHVAEGRQAYIVCPMIEENASLSEKASANAYYAKLKQEWFCDTPVGLLHGRMKQAQKDEVMLAFKRGELAVLVSTTVIEVGVDVPNSVVMLIENAEQFGLSQLHQLRGRVGRGGAQSYCVLITDSKTPYTRARIDTMVRTTDGFEIANEDLKLRGPGDFFGSKQHGLPELKIADMTEDISLVDRTSALAERILEEDPTLSLPQHAGLRAMVEGLFGGEDEGYGFN